MPLHIQTPPLPHVDWAECDAIVARHGSDADVATWLLLTASYRHQSVCELLLTHRDSALDCTAESSLLKGDLTAMLGANFARPCPEDQLHPRFSLLHVFSVVEEAKGRRRAIAWPRAFNSSERIIIAFLKSLGHAVVFPRVELMRDKVRYMYAAQLDLKKYFQQFAFDSTRLMPFAAREKPDGDLKLFTLSSVPTGAASPPLWAQALTSSVVRGAVAAARCQTSSSSDVAVDVMIDNIRVCTDDHRLLTLVWDELLSSLRRLGITVGDTQPPPCLDSYPAPYVFCGMLFDHSTKTVSNSVKSLRKLTTAASVLLSPAHWVHVQSLFGICLWASRVIGTPLCYVYWIVKFMRRKARAVAAMAQDQPRVVEVWSSIVPLWQSWILHLSTTAYQLQPAPPSPSSQTRHFTCFVDASDQGYGLVIYPAAFTPSNDMHIFGAAWSSAESRLHINVKELLSVKKLMLVLRHVLDLRDNFDCDIFIDNTSAQAWWTKQVAPTYLANEVIKSGRSVFAAAAAVSLRFARVCSGENLADWPSRHAAFHKGGGDISWLTVPIGPEALAPIAEFAEQRGTGEPT